MGISGLLPLLKEITHARHIKDFKGKTLAVDAYVWLHRGAYGCAEELATGRPTIKYVNYAMHRVRMLKYYGVTPYIVFDGGLLPSKMGTEGDREKRRNDALAKGNAFLAEGKATQARECFVKAVDVTPAMAYQLIKALRQEGVQYVVAPYEADPQLAYLEKRGLVDGIITEDSDLLVFGCRTVLFKLDGEGNCVSISRDDFSQCKEYNFSEWGDKEFRQMAILSGCDYLDSIVGLGLKTAYRLMRKYKTAEKVIQFVRLDGQLTVPRNYLDEFKRAEHTFLHQRVFDPVARRLVHFSPLPPGKTALDMPFVGAELDNEYACGLADGDIDPLSKVAMIDLMPNSFSSNTAQRTTYKPSPSTSSSNSKTKAAQVQPAKGASSLLSFFSRTPVASTSSAINPVKNVANQKRVRLVKGKENDSKVTAVPSPKRKSKFFGKSASVEVKSLKGKEKMVVEIEEEIIVEEMEEQAPPSGDEDAGMALREIEMDVSVVGSVEMDADNPELDQVNDETASLSPRPPSPPVPCVSSPLSTPPRKRAKLSASPLLSKQGQPDLASSPPLPIHSQSSAQPISDDAPISSPVSSARADAGWDGPSISSPPAAVSPPLPSRPALQTIKPEAEKVEIKVVKAEQKLTTTINKRNGVEFLELSSDPIDIASSDSTDGNDQGSTPRVSTSTTSRPPPARTHSTSQGKKLVNRKSGSKPIEVRPDEPVSVKGKGKKRAKVEVVEEEEEEEDSAVKTVAASWRAKFMLQNSSSNRTPRPKTNARPSIIPNPTPETSSRPPSLEKLTSTSLAATSPRNMKPLSTSAQPRIPLSPRSTNRISRKVPPHLLLAPSAASSNLTAPSPPSPPPKRRKLSTTPLTDQIQSSQPSNEGSSSPVIITNPKLLAFKFKGKSSSPT
ncbi:hypothetical protein JCM5353_005370 [Sporobolomyces roseus]